MKSLFQIVDNKIMQIFPKSKAVVYVLLAVEAIPELIAVTFALFAKCIVIFFKCKSKRTAVTLIFFL